jgi:hypothetical protein
VVAELVAVLRERLQALRVCGARGAIRKCGVTVGIAPDDKPRDVNAAAREQIRRAGQRTLEDHVLELGRMRAEAVDPVVAGDAVEIDRDRAVRPGHGFPPNRIT